MEQKKEYSNEWLARMFAAYMGCDCDTTFTSKNGKIISKVTGIVNNYVFFKDVLETVHTSRLKPLLAPLSAISDEHAIEVAKMLQENTNCDWVGSDDLKKAIIDVCLGICGQFDGDSDIFCHYYDPEEIGLGATLITHIIDYLRSKGYDCGFMGVPSLIDAGLAVKA